MNHDIKLPHRCSIRLKGYDYTRPGAYFVTICIQDHTRLFGNIVDGEIMLNPAGEMVINVWHEIPTHYPGVEIDAFVVMPNHIHGIIILLGYPPVGADPCVRPKLGQPRGVAPTLSLPELDHRFKTVTTKRYVDEVKKSDWPTFPNRLWQRNYWEHVIRNERMLNAVRTYIEQNPLRWELDRYNANATGKDPLAKALWQTLKTSAKRPDN